jgi:hypothetical protein
MEPSLFLNHTVSSVIGVRETKGSMFGIELELEGRGVGLADVATRGWGRKHENSLRGEAMEFATQGSATFDDSQKRVDELFKKFTANKVKFNNSIRTSTHVHLNFSDKKIKDVINFFSLFTVFEEVLQYYSGEDRKGNLFCISSREAEGIIGVLFDGIGRGDLSRFGADRYKYAACNLSSLFKFGTVEIRTMKGADTAQQVNTWLSILNDMYNYSLTKMKSPVDLVVDFSHLGAEGLLRKVFSGSNVRELMGTFPKVASLHASLMEGVRLIQVFAYSYEQDFLAEVKLDTPKAKKIVGTGHPLPRRAPDGREYTVYRVDDLRWHVVGEMGIGDFWIDGERVVDDRTIWWNQQAGRFYQFHAGRDVPLDWARHPEFGDERVARGGALARAALARAARRAPPIIVEDDDDDDEEIEDRWDEFEEGDEI